MFTLVIQEKNGPSRTENFEQPEVTIGRVQGNDVVLPKGNISKKHSRIVLRDGKFIVVDLKSTNGTYVNGKRINAPQVLKEADKVFIGDYTITVDSPAGGSVEPDEPPPAAAAPVVQEPARMSPPGADEEPFAFEDDDEDLFGNDDDPLADLIAAAPEQDYEPEPEPPRASPPEPPRPEPPRPEPPRPEPQRAQPREASPPRGAAPAREPTPAAQPAHPPRVSTAAKPGAAHAESLQPSLPPQAVLQARAAVYLAVARAHAVEGILPADDDATKSAAEATARSTVRAVSHKLGGVDASAWPQEIVRELCGVGPLDSLLEAGAFDELFVNGPHYLCVRQDGRMRVAPGLFSSEESLALVVRRLAAAAGLAFDAESPVVEFRLPDGSRVHAVHHSACARGPALTVTRAGSARARLDELVDGGVLSVRMAEFLRTCVRARRNIAVCGVAGAGVGALIHALAAEISPHERIIGVQRVAQLELPQPHVVMLEPRPSRSGARALPMRDVVAHALRMRPDRLVVHELEGAEALDLLTAMGGGRDGTLLSSYASSTRDALERLETLMRMSGQNLPSRVAREVIAQGIDVLVHVTRFAQGDVRVSEIVEVVGTEVDIITCQELFAFKREGFSDTGEVRGRFVSSGTPPRFYDELQRRGEVIDLALFRDD